MGDVRRHGAAAIAILARRHDGRGARAGCVDGRLRGTAAGPGRGRRSVRPVGADEAGRLSLLSRPLRGAEAGRAATLAGAEPARRSVTTAARATVMAAMRHLIVIGLAALLPACASLSPDGGLDAVAGIAGAAMNKDVAAPRTPEEAEAVRTRVKALLGRRLSADA